MTEVKTDMMAGAYIMAVVVGRAGPPKPRSPYNMEAFPSTVRKR